MVDVTRAVKRHIASFGFQEVIEKGRGKENFISSAHSPLWLPGSNRGGMEH